MSVSCFESEKIMLRIKALFDCLYFALVPYWVYEDSPHYGEERGAYLHHARINWRVAKHWLTFSETESMIQLAKAKTTYVKW